ncbi:hypothetical protein PPTG_07819 [Phytophthora nicotianae INRA-310]|uniref:Myosin-binding domain-containing protein n=1 Tax=Phytophthora nicotianae (strain INRA-310) TaxID=761204 RepID=W2QLV4_PHYN3|nr:hypothetical protein PPTG_07819 [Phytophthora nicotianae INRA-310]ETN14167.1 hypothetical protein PPTG_07819 [Phytophthora nicotianae INRA-310]
MEIAVASSSPLGQYLAELEADGGESMAQLLSDSRPVASRKRPRRPTRQEPRNWSWMQFAHSLRYRLELVAARRLLPELCAFHPTIREELQQAASGEAAILFESHGGWWARHVAVVEVLSGVEMAAEELWRVCATVGGASVAAIATVASSWGSEGVSILWAMEWVVTIAVFVLLWLELSMRLLLGWCVRRSGRLVASLNGFIGTLEKFNKVYASSLTLVKRAELASRGYRLGAGLLPPIGRLEASNAEPGNNDEGAAVSAAKNRLRCLSLRRKLRALNDQLQIQASTFMQEAEQTTDTKNQKLDDIGDDMDKRAPSLLLTALSKQHNRAVLLLENAVHAALMRSMAGVCSSRDSKMNCSFLFILGSHQVAVDQLTKALSLWTADLEAWNSTKDPVALLTSSRTNSPERQQQYQITPPTPDDPRLKSVATQLQDLRSTSETLTALVIAAQYELLSVKSASNSLDSSRDAMRSMVQQLQETWSNYDNALSALKGDKNPQDMPADEEADESCESKPIEVVALTSSVAPEDPNCTVVFTGTSTGDDSFDLLSLLKQQEADTPESSGPTPHFVRELRDVLAHRVPGLTKQVDHDPLIPSTPPIPPADNAILPPPPTDDMFALPRAPPRGGPRRPSTRANRDPSAAISPTLPRDNKLSGVVATAFNLELQTLLQRIQSSQQPNSIDCIGDSAEETDVDLLSSEKM